MQPTTSVHGLPRIGRKRELKWALERYWSGRVTADELRGTAADLRRRGWDAAARIGIDLVPSNDFSLYDHVLDTAVMVGAVPARFGTHSEETDLDTYFKMARGAGDGEQVVAPLSLTKWFDTNYHFLRPELSPATTFDVHADKAVGELTEATARGVTTTPVLLGPLSFLLLASREPAHFDVLKHLDPLVEVYCDVVDQLGANGARWVQFDEPVLAADRDPSELDALERAYRRLGECSPRPNLVLSTYFGDVGTAMERLTRLPVEGIGLDLCAGPGNLEQLRQAGGLRTQSLFAGVVDGRNVWAADLDATLGLLEEAHDLAPGLVVSTSCSLLHVPWSVADETALDLQLTPWLAFAEEKLGELALLARGLHEGRGTIDTALTANRAVLERRHGDARLEDPSVRRRMDAIGGHAGGPAQRRAGTVSSRRAAQSARLALPAIPTSTIGSFPQTDALRTARAARRNGRLGDAEYHQRLRSEIDHVVALQEEIGLDVLVHGEPERDDMVRYFAAHLTGFALPQAGWVQSYGSRCVRPPIIYGDVSRPGPMTVEWTTYAAGRTSKPVKAMLTGPVTMLHWSFVRDDQSWAATATQLALAIADEVADLEAAGLGVVQVDEPALREGLPLRRGAQGDYLAWATGAFRLAVSPAQETTQVHTHMCYADFSQIADALADLDVDVISLEAARSGMSELGPLARGRYEGDIGPGLYDVHSPNVPSVDELDALLTRAIEALGAGRVWANPDCGLKTRSYDQVVPALQHMVEAARRARDRVNSSPPLEPGA